MPSPLKSSFGGRIVAAFESRRTQEMAALIERYEGQAVVTPALREVMVEDDGALSALGERLLRGRIDAMVFFTAVGARGLVDGLAAHWAREAVLAALGRLPLIARGPKTVRALRELGLPLIVGVPEPGTWRDTLHALEAEPRGLDLRGARIAVQEYGTANEAFCEALRAHGAVVESVPVYRWALPADVEPLRAAVARLIDGGAQISLFTNSTQVEHLFRVAAAGEERERLRAGLSRTLVGSIGPSCSEALAAFAVPVDVEADPSRMEVLVEAAAQRGAELAREGTPPWLGDDSGRRTRRGVTARERAPAEQPAAGAGPAWHDSRFMRACRREPVDSTPIWLMRQAGRYMPEYRELRRRVSFLDLCRSPSLVSEVTVSAAQRIGADAAILFADLLLIVEPMGLQLEFTRGEGPVIQPVVRTAADVARLPETCAVDCLGYVFDAVRQTRSDLDERLPLIGFSGAPFTLASYLVEGGSSRTHEHTRALMQTDPGAWNALMERIVRALVPYLNGQIDAGCQAVQIFDSWVGCLGVADYREYVIPHTRALADGIRSGVPVIHFGTGTAALLESMREAGGDIIGLDWRVELDAAWSRVGTDRGVMGNLDPVTLLADRGTIRRRAERILRQAAGRPGHIFNLGHGVLPATPVENVVALVEFVHEFSAGGERSAGGR